MSIAVLLLLAPGVLGAQGAKPSPRQSNDLARFIAGLPPERAATVSPALLQSSDWNRFAGALEKRWQAYEKSSLAGMKAWRDRELKPLDGDAKTVFYPFSGPDFVNVYTFFPHADRYVLVGLEPVGTLPDLTDEASVSAYFTALNRSLNAVMSFSFFRTQNLAVDLKTGPLDGALHLLLLFLARTGNRVTDVRPVTVDDKGRVVPSRAIESPQAGVAPNRGVEISFVGPTGAPRTLSYFAVNLSDPLLKKNPGFVSYLEGLRPMATYVKSATYLMHKPYFSTVRNAILTQSKCVLQDDSGIPYRAFSPSTWDVKLYGSYHAPISLFTAFYQPDLKSAYQTKQVKELGFGIGYQYRLRESNLMLAIRPKL